MNVAQTAPITPRLRAALATGGIDGLFPLLAGWNRVELKALEADVDAWHQACMAQLDSMFEKYVSDPEFFFSNSGQQLLDKTVNGARLEVVQVASEILSVVYFYLGGFAAHPTEARQS